MLADSSRQIQAAGEGISRTLVGIQQQIEAAVGVVTDIGDSVAELRERDTALAADRLAHRDRRSPGTP